MMKNMIRKLIIIASFFSIGACSDTWLGGSENKTKAVGNRVSIFDFDKQISAKKRDHEKIKISAALPVHAWENSNEFQYDKPGNVAVAGKLTDVESHRISSYSLSGHKRLSTPIVANGKIFVLAEKAKVFCIDEKDLNSVVWQQEAGKFYRNMISGGGLSHHENVIYATFGHRNVAAMKAENGEILWNVQLNNTTKSAPFFHEGMLFVMTADNKIYCLNPTNGQLIWAKELGAEKVSVMANSGVSASKGKIFVPTSNGELVLIDGHSGEILWNLNFALKKIDVTGFTLNDINIAPLIDGHEVYVAGQMGAVFALRENGEFLWQQEIKEPKSLWQSGNALFVVDGLNRLLALSKKDGAILWISEFPIYVSDGKNEKLALNGPIMANGKLILVSSNGELIFVNPENGVVLSKLAVPKDISTAPIIVKNQIYLLDNRGNIIRVR